MNKTIFRPSLPEDVERAAPLIYSSGPDAFDYVFKSNKSTALEFLKFAFVRPEGEFGYKNHISILIDDQVVGVGAAFTGDEMLGFTWAALKKIVKFYKWDAFRIIKNGLTVEALIKPPKKNEVAIGHLGIHESARGQGLGTKLIHYLMHSPKIESQKYFVLDVSKENPRAQKLYENFGYKVEKICLSKLKNKYASIVDHHRMSMEIDKKL